MENTRKLNPDFEAIAWGAFFIFWGFTEMFEFLPHGTGAVGIGLILTGLNLARWWKGIPVSGFTTPLGIVALVVGGLELAQPFLHLSFEIPAFAILLLVFGVAILARQFARSRNQ